MLNKKVIFAFQLIFPKFDFMTQIIYFYPKTSVFSFHTFVCCFLISVSKKGNIEKILTLPFLYNWQKFKKMKEESMGPKYVTGQITSHILQLLLRQFYHFIFASSQKS